MLPDQDTILTPLHEAPARPLAQAPDAVSSPSDPVSARPASAFGVTRSYAADHYRRLREAVEANTKAPASNGSASAHVFRKTANLLTAANRLLAGQSKVNGSSATPAANGSAIPLPAAPEGVPGPAVAPDLAATAAPPKKVRFSFEAVREYWPFFKRLWVYLRPYKFRFILGEAAGMGFAFFNMLIPLMLKVVFDHVNTAQASGAPGAGGGLKQAATASPAGGGMMAYLSHLAEGKHGVLLVCMSIPGIMILRGLFDYLNDYSMAWVSLRVLGDMRKQVFAHISSQSLDFFHTNRAGELISRVSNDTRAGQTALALVGSDLIKQPLTVVTCIFALLHLDVRFTFISLVLFPLCMIPVAIYGKRIRKNGRAEEEQAGAMMVILTETFAGIRVIKSFAREDYQVKQFDNANMRQFQNAIRVRKATEIVSPMVEVIAALGVGLALFYVHARGMELGKFLGLTGGLFLLYNPLKQISRMHMQIQKCQAALGQLFLLLELKPTIVDAPDAVDLKECKGKVVFDNVSFQYTPNGTPALSEFTMRIQPGRYVALVGASGAGKSTVLSLLQRFYDPASGSVRIDKKDLRTLTQRSVRENVGVVTQDTFLFHDTIYNNILYGRLEATQEEVYEAARKAYAHDFILGLPEGYETRVGDKGCRLSGGQQQRLAIARALLKDAPILLLDEATSALDSESELMIQTALETLVRGRTVIAIAHRLSTILKADRIIVMDAGQIVEYGTHAELYAHGGRYRRLYDLQFDHEARAQETPVEGESNGDGQNVL